MKLIERLEEVKKELITRKLNFALAGGLVASIYRNEPRATSNIDILVFTENESEAYAILHSLSLTAYSLRKAQLEGGPLLAIKKKYSCLYSLRSQRRIK